MKASMSVLACVLALSLVAGVSSARADISVSITEVPPVPDVPSLWICQWIELSTANNTVSWIVHADEDIADLHFGTWDNDDYVVPGTIQPMFDQSSHTCTYEGVGGPPGTLLKQYWQTLDLWGGTGLPFCHYYEIVISEVPVLYGGQQNLLVHATPEPTALALLGLGALTVLRRWRA